MTPNTPRRKFQFQEMKAKLQSFHLHKRHLTEEDEESSVKEPQVHQLAIAVENEESSVKEFQAHQFATMEAIRILRTIKKKEGYHLSPSLQSNQKEDLH